MSHNDDESVTYFPTCSYDCVQYTRHEVERSKDTGVAVVVLKFVQSHSKQLCFMHSK